MVALTISIDLSNSCNIEITELLLLFFVNDIFISSNSLTKLFFPRTNDSNNGNKRFAFREKSALTYKETNHTLCVGAICCMVKFYVHWVGLWL